MVTLTTGADTVLESPDEAAITRVLKTLAATSRIDGPYAVLQKDDGFLQTAVGDTPGLWIMEYRQAPSKPLYRCANEVPHPELIETFKRYLRGDPRWKTELKWGRFDCEKGQFYADKFTTCAACGKKVSRRAVNCPACGAPVEDRSTSGYADKPHATEGVPVMASVRANSTEHVMENAFKSARAANLGLFTSLMISLGAGVLFLLIFGGGLLLIFWVLCKTLHLI